jgi:cyclase
MKRIMQIVPALCLSLILVGTAVAQDWEKIEFKSDELAPGLWVVYGAGGNHVLASGPDGPLLIDADYTEMGEKLLAKVHELAGDGPLRVIDTHWHFDHAGGNRTFRAAGATLIAHKNVRDRMIAGLHLAVIDETIPPAEAIDLPDITFDTELTIHLGEEAVSVFHVPAAHTSGDAVVHFPTANVIHSGDIVFNCGYPFIDVNDGGSIDGMIVAVKAILERCDDETQIVPGHGPVADQAGLKVYLGLLEGFREAVAGAKADGMSLEEVLASTVTAKLDEEWGKRMFPPEAFKELVYRTLPD